MNDYNPAAVSALECPVHHRAQEVDFSRFFPLESMQDLCIALCGVPDPSAYDFTKEEWKAIADVANGAPWPVPDRPYTADDWHHDREFSAAPGQEISPEIYEDMLDVLPPLSLPRCQRTRGYDSGFMVSEAMTHDPKTYQQMYNAFGRKNGKCYYIGILPRRPAV